MANKMAPMSVVVFVLALILGTTNTTAQATYQCLGLLTSIITSCGNPISTQCCDTLKYIAYDGDVCKCLKELKHHPLMASSKAQQLPRTCNFPVISPILKCFAPIPPSIGLLPPISRPSQPPTPAALPAAPLASPPAS